MIVEDESITAMDITGKLRELGYEVVDVVGSGSQAIENARKIHPDLILTDIMLKGDVNGINVAESIKDLDIPVVYLTAYADGKLLERAKLTSPYGYIIKPYLEEELKTTIEMALHKHQADQLKIKDVVKKLTTKEEELKIEKLPNRFPNSDVTYNPNPVLSQGLPVARLAPLVIPGSTANLIASAGAVTLCW